MMNTKRQTFFWYGLMIFAALAGSAWIYATRMPTQSIANLVAPRVNFPAPAFTLNTLDDKTISLDDLRGKVVIVNFWATWCPPCRAEMPMLQAYSAENKNRGVIVLAIDVGEEKEVTQKFAADLGLTLPILLDHDTTVMTQFRVQALPTSFFIDREGVIRAVYLGAMNRAYVESQVNPLLEAH
jgi:cytochrome c biogenesis protein CcmG, thiol:disulfide interchange protein DsbE